jgi:hypothetical protein
LADHADVTLGGPASVVDYLNDLGVVANSG